MSDYIKLTEPGASLTFVVKSVTVVATGNWPDLHFLTERGEIVVAPKTAMGRELDKMKLTDWQQTIGMALTVSRSPKIGANGKPFWDCALAAGGYADPLRPSLTEKAKAEAEKVRVAKGLPKDDDREIPPPSDADAPDASPSFVQSGSPARPAVEEAEQDKAERYFELARRVAKFQAGIGKIYECPFDLGSINAMTFSIWNTR